MSKPVLYLFNGKVGAFGRAFLGFTPPDIYTVTLDTVTHGSITASPMSGIAGTTITLTGTPDSGYELDYFTVNGVAIVGNTFTMPAENVTIGAVFVEESLFKEVTIGGQVWADRNLSIDDGQGGITIVDGNYYYSVAAATRIAATFSGWRLPTKSDFVTLISYAGIGAIASVDGWTNGGGTNTTGFNAIPYGSYVHYSGPPSYWSLSNVGTVAAFTIQPYVESRDTFYGAYNLRKSGSTFTSDTFSSSTYEPDGARGNLRLIKDS